MIFATVLYSEVCRVAATESLVLSRLIIASICWLNINDEREVMI